MKHINRIFIVLAWFAIISSIAIMILVGYWLLRPYKVVEVQQPFEILNENRIININQKIVMRVSFEKYMNISVMNYPSLQCVSGNLVTLTPYQSNMPVGKSIFISDRFVLPPKVTVGDKCQYVQTQTYKVNPIRVMNNTFKSEYFIVGSQSSTIIE